MNKYYLLLAVLVLSVSSISQEKILIVGAKAHIGNGKVINNSLIGIKNKRIVLVKNALVTNFEASEWDTIIRAKGQHIYPGFIAPNATLGLVEIEAVRATRDVDEVGHFTPHVRSIIAFNTDSRVTPTALTNGVLMAQITPRGGTISGTSSIVKFDQRNWDSSIVKIDDGIHLNWPKVFKGGGWWANPKPHKQNEKYAEEVKKIKAFFEQAKAYSQIKKSKQEVDVRMESMRGLFSGQKQLFIHCNLVPQMNDVIALCEALDIPKKVIVGGEESYLIAERLKENDFSVMIGRTHQLPSHEDASIDEAYQLPSQLLEKELLFCFQNAGNMEAMNTRNLPFNAGSAVGFGLSEEEALEAITLSAAKILNIDKDYGSLEEGKVATLFISKGNALEVMTNEVQTILIEGRFVEVTNDQIELYQEYKSFYRP